MLQAWLTFRTQLDLENYGKYNHVSFEKKQENKFHCTMAGPKGLPMTTNTRFHKQNGQDCTTHAKDKWPCQRQTAMPLAPTPTQTTMLISWHNYASLLLSSTLLKMTILLTRSRLFPPESNVSWLSDFSLSGVTIRY